MKLQYITNPTWLKKMAMDIALVSPKNGVIL
jgi:hypothetical protein